MSKGKQTISKQLAKCPFCGILLKLVGSKQRGNQHYLHEYNSNCILNGFGFIATDENIEHWNTRKPMQNIVERLEETLNKTMEENSQEWDSYIRKVNLGKCVAFKDSIEIVKEEGGIDGRNL